MNRERWVFKSSDLFEPGSGSLPYAGQVHMNNMANILKANKAPGSEVVVLTRGMLLVLQTCPETLRMLRDRGIPVHVEETKAAVALYNKLAETEAVGGLFHSTC